VIDMNATEAPTIDVAGPGAPLPGRLYGAMLGSLHVQAASMGARLGWHGGTGAYVPVYEDRVSLVELAS
jgi:hypothetical protein